MPSAIDSSTPRSPSALRARVTAASKHANLPQRKKTRKNRRRTAPPVTTPGGPNYRKSAGPNRGNRAVQRSDGCANRVLDFIRAFLTPARFVGRSEEFENHRRELNAILAFSGLEYGADGQFRKIAAAQTLDEAEARARTVRKKFKGRRIHPEVLKYVSFAFSCSSCCRRRFRSAGPSARTACARPERVPPC